MGLFQLIVRQDVDSDLDFAQAASISGGFVQQCELRVMANAAAPKEIAGR